MALAAEKGVDYSKQSLKKAQKQAAKQKRAKTGDASEGAAKGKKGKKEEEGEDWEDVSEEENVVVGADLEEEGGLTEDEEDLVDGPQVCAQNRRRS